MLYQKQKKAQCFYLKSVDNKVFKNTPKNTYNFLLKIYYARVVTLRNIFSDILGD